MPFMSADEFRERLPEVLDHLDEWHEPVVITRDGTRAAVLLSMDRFDAVKDILEDWEDEHDPELWEEIRQAREEYEREGGIDFDEFVARLGNEDVSDTPAVPNGSEGDRVSAGDREGTDHHGDPGPHRRSSRTRST